MFNLLASPDTNLHVPRPTHGSICRKIARQIDMPNQEPGIFRVHYVYYMKAFSTGKESQYFIWWFSWSHYMRPNTEHNLLANPTKWHIAILSHSSHFLLLYNTALMSLRMSDFWYNAQCQRLVIHRYADACTYCYMVETVDIKIIMMNLQTLLVHHETHNTYENKNSQETPPMFSVNFESS